MFIGTALLAGVVFSATARGETVIRVGGSGSALGTMNQLAAAYEKSHPGTKIRILPSLGSTAGVKAVLGGALDVGVTSRPLMESERQQGAIAVEYAKSPFCFVTNNKVNKRDISLRELETIYSNPATAKWPDNSRVRLILRPERDIDTKLLRSLSPGMEKAMKSALTRPGMIMATTDQESTDTIIKIPGSLGAATLGEIISGNRPVNVLSFNGIKPGDKNIANKTYPLVKSFYLVTTAKISTEARQFAEFLRSPAAAGILVKTGNTVVTLK